MDFALPADLVAYLSELDQFIAREIKPIEDADDNIRFFDHRREWARTDFDHGGLPRKEWEALLRRVKNLADAAGHLRFAIPKRYGGKDGSNLWMAVIREHFASKGLGLHNDLQNESSVVGNFPQVLMFRDFGTDEQKKTILPGMLAGKIRLWLHSSCLSAVWPGNYANWKRPARPSTWFKICPSLTLTQYVEC